MKQPQILLYQASNSHQESFERIYKTLPELYNVRFPLAEIENIDWNRGAYTNAYYSYHYCRFTAHIYDLLELIDGQAVLIVGCGFGFDEKNIKTLYPKCDLFSLDISEEMLKRAQRSGTPTMLAWSPAENLPFPDGCFDRVLSREVIEHVMDPQRMLREIARVLKPNGLAVITTENEESLGPTNFFDSRIRPALAESFGIELPIIPYQDEAPTYRAFTAMASVAELDLVKTTYDGSVYKYLISLNLILKDKLAAVAHYLSCLENSKVSAFLFCDQVKYKLRKRGSTGSVQNSVYYVCPTHRTQLTAIADGKYQCNICMATFSSAKGFLDLKTETTEPSVKSENGADSVSVSQKGKLKRYFFFHLIDKTRKMYIAAYLTAALCTSLFVKKNTKASSYNLKHHSPYYRYLIRPCTKSF